MIRFFVLFYLVEGAMGEQPSSSSISPALAIEKPAKIQEHQAEQKKNTTGGLIIMLRT